MALIVNPLYDAERKKFMYWAGRKYENIDVGGGSGAENDWVIPDGMALQGSGGGSLYSIAELALTGMSQTRNYEAIDNAVTGYDAGNPIYSIASITQAKQLYGVPISISAQGVYTINSGAVGQIVYSLVSSTKNSVLYSVDKAIALGGTFDLANDLFDNGESYATFLANCFSNYEEFNADDVHTVEMSVLAKGTMTFSVTPSSITYVYAESQDIVKIGNTSTNLEFKTKNRPSVIEANGGIHSVAYVSDIEAISGKLIPDPPSDDATYTLMCTVTNGVPTYMWA